jgi:hypothetical protein
MDIYEFAHAALPENVSLYPMQRAILRAFYRETEYNEKLDSYGSSDDVALPPGTHLPNAEPVELIWITGRRSGKDLMLSLMAWYEFAKLSRSDHDPEPTLANKKINIMVLCPTSAMARVFWQELMSMYANLSKFDYYRGTHFFPKNKVEVSNTKMTATTYTSWGCVELIVRSASSESISGIGVQTLILNDAAHMSNVTGVIGALQPTLYIYKKHKLIMATTPRSFSSFWEGWTQPQEHRLVVVTPTWVVNPKYEEQTLRQSETAMSDEQFQMEFGAGFGLDERNEQITFRLKQSVIDNLKRIARRRSYELDSDITYTDVIREILEAAGKSPAASGI